MHRPVARLLSHPLLAVSLVAFAVVAPAPASAQDVIREGSGERREALNEMELTPFDADLWLSLEDWHNREITPANTDGKVVLIYTFSSFLPNSTRPLVAMSRLAQDHADDGLIVVGVHHEEGYEDAKALADRRRVAFPLARDVGGSFREALMVDADPDFYLIDRSGQMRFADIGIGSVSSAVEMLLDETSERAASTRERIEQGEAERKARLRRLDAIRRSVSLSDLPAIDFDEPPASAYEDASWPRFPQPSQSSRDEAEPFDFDFPASGRWTPEAPNRRGKVTLIYFWVPGMASLLEYFTSLDLVQKDYERDLVVVGALLHQRYFSDGRGREEERERMEREAERGNEMFDRFHEKLPVNHYLFNNLLAPEGDYIQTQLDLDNARGSEATALPFYALVDSSGTVRWWGSITSLRQRERFAAALKRVLEVDPGVQARRAAENEYIAERTEERVREAED